MKKISCVVFGRRKFVEWVWRLHMPTTQSTSSGLKFPAAVPPISESTADSSKEQEIKSEKKKEEEKTKEEKLH